MTQMSPRTSRDRGFRFAPFSRRQKLVLTWWCPDSVFADYDGIICDGSIRSGKSMTMSLSFGMWATENFNGCNFGICGKTIGSLRRNVINDMKKMLTARGYHVEDKRSLNMLVISRKNNSNNFYLFGGTNESSQDLIQGITLAGVFLDEAAIMPESFINQATGRCSVEGAKLWFSCNPAGGQTHWFKQNWINQYRAKKLLYLHFTMDDNPSMSEKTKARYRSLYTGAFYRRYIEGRWVAAEGVIYHQFSREKNTYVKPLDKELRQRCIQYVSIDYGSANPTAFLHILYDPKERMIYIDREYYHDARKEMTQKSDAQYGNDLIAFLPPGQCQAVVIDPSALSLRIVIRRLGYHIREANNDVCGGIQDVSVLIALGKIKINNTCVNLLKEIDTYVWNEKAAQEQGIDKPVKQNDHAVDALRYFVNTIIKMRQMLA